MIDIKKQFSVDLAKKILTKSAALDYLKRMNEIKPIVGLYVDDKLVSSSSIVWELVVRSWDYDISKNIIRELFKGTEKYKRGIDANRSVSFLREEWERLNLGRFSWPFSQGAFDNFVQRINSESISSALKDTKVKEAAVKFRRIKEINTYRNDYIETMIYEVSDAILPTLKHRRGVDFYIDGISFDQKVSRSVTNEFKDKYKDTWREVAINNPEIVAEYLYSHQDEGRFDAEPRLLIVYVDEDVSADRIYDIISKTDLYNPITVTFSYNHRNSGYTTYSTPCIVILLYN